MQRLQIECAAWSCGLILHHPLLTIQFASLISSLINIISLLLTTFDWTKVRGIAPRSHTGRPRTCLIIIVIISDPRRGCFMESSTFIFFFFFFPPLLSGPYLWNRYSQRLQIECAAWSCGLVLHYCLPSNSLCYFFFNFFLFFAKILSGSYLWNRYSQRLQIECAAWFCGLVLHYCLPSNSLRNFFFFNFFFFSVTILSGPYLWNHYSQKLQIECAAWFCGLVLHYCLPSNSLRNFFFLLFRHDFVRAISLEPLLAETPN